MEATIEHGREFIVLFFVISVINSFLLVKEVRRLIFSKVIFDFDLVISCFLFLIDLSKRVKTKHLFAFRTIFSIFGSFLFLLMVECLEHPFSTDIYVFLRICCLILGLLSDYFRLLHVVVSISLSLILY